MSTNKTANLNMHSWDVADYVLRAEFNENFNILDSEIGSRVGKLLTSYTLTSNAEYSAVSVNLTTGVFTTATPHGLTGSRAIIVAFNQNVTIDIRYMPKELVCHTSFIFLVVDSDTTFHISTTNGGSAIVFTDASNTLVDVTKFHFEIPPTTIAIDNMNYNAKKIRFIVNGFRGRVGQTYHKANNKASVASVDGKHLTFIYTDGVVVLSTERKIVSIYGVYGSKNVNTSSYGSWNTANGSFYNFEFDSSAQITKVSIDGDWANGTTLEVYSV